LNSAGRSEIGLCRATNEDSILKTDTKIGCLPNLYIVADGMGGHKAGEVASSKAIKFFCDYIEKNRECRLKENYEYIDMIKKAISYANREINEMSKHDENLIGMGTTFVVAVIKDKFLIVENIGDSRLYLIRDNEMIQITIDHTYVMELVKEGSISKEEMENHPIKNVITRAVGTEENVLADSFEIEIKKGDIVVMCSDGLSNMVKENEIADIIFKSENIDKAAEILVEQANKNGGTDNISVIVIDAYKEVIEQC